MSDSIHFQNPDTGWPLVLVVDRHERQLEVVVGDGFDEREAGDETISDAREMTVQLRERHITDLVEGARYLKRSFGIDY